MRRELCQTARGSAIKRVGVAAEFEEEDVVLDALRVEAQRGFGFAVGSEKGTEGGLLVLALVDADFGVVDKFLDGFAVDGVVD